jgi:SAM-dependent methyltransferase
MFKWFRRSTLDPLAVSMSGVKLADRLLVIGCSDPVLIAAIAAKVGLTGRACAVDEDPSLVTNAAQIAEREGVLIESAPAPGLRVPYPDESFDVVVVRDTGSSTMITPGSPVFAEARRALRSGGRCVVILGETRGGFGGLFGGSRPPQADSVTPVFQSAGFLAVRTLAEREGLLYLEGVKPATHGQT